MNDILVIARNRLDTLSDDLIIRKLCDEVTTLREDLREVQLFVAEKNKLIERLIAENKSLSVRRCRGESCRDCK